MVDLKKDNKQISNDIMNQCKHFNNIADWLDKRSEQDKSFILLYLLQNRINDMEKIMNENYSRANNSKTEKKDAIQAMNTFIVAKDLHKALKDYRELLNFDLW